MASSGYICVQVQLQSFTGLLHKSMGSWEPSLGFPGTSVMFRDWSPGGARERAACSNTLFSQTELGGRGGGEGDAAGFKKKKSFCSLKSCCLPF